MPSDLETLSLNCYTKDIQLLEIFRLHDNFLIQVEATSDSYDDTIVMINAMPSGLGTLSLYFIPKISKYFVSLGNSEYLITGTAIPRCF